MRRGLILLAFGLQAVAAQTGGGAPAALPADLAPLRRLAAWRTTVDPAMPNSPGESCGIASPASFLRLRLDHEAAGGISNEAATREITALDGRVVRALRKAGWTEVSRGAGGGIPNLNRCYRKSGRTAQVFETTGRCTMNSKCRTFDGLAVVLYLPL